MSLEDNSLSNRGLRARPGWHARVGRGKDHRAGGRRCLVAAASVQPATRGDGEIRRNRNGAYSSWRALWCNTVSGAIDLRSFTGAHRPKPSRVETCLPASLFVARQLGIDILSSLALLLPVSRSGFEHKDHATTHFADEDVFRLQLAIVILREATLVPLG